MQFAPLVPRTLLVWLLDSMLAPDLDWADNRAPANRLRSRARDHAYRASGPAQRKVISVPGVCTLKLRVVWLVQQHSGTSSIAAVKLLNRTLSIDSAYA